jgi:hypothetical protein
MPAGVVLLVFMAFQAVEQSFMKLPEAVVAGAAAVVAFAAGAAAGTTHFAATNCFQVMPAGVVLLSFMAFQAAEQSFMKLPEAAAAPAAGAVTAAVAGFVAAVVAFAAGAAAGTTHLAATNCFQVMPSGVVLLAFMAFQAVEQSFMKLPDADAVSAGATGAAVVVALAGFVAGVAGGVVAAAASVPQLALR